MRFGKISEIALLFIVSSSVNNQQYLPIAALTAIS